jgi:hypothetical protein
MIFEKPCSSGQGFFLAGKIKKGYGRFVSSTALESRDNSYKTSSIVLRQEAASG